jgi:hypothetical protein
MNQQNSEYDWEKRLQELEVEVNSSGTEDNPIPSSSPVSSHSNQFSSKVQTITTQVRRWFEQLPVLGKVIVGAIAVGVSFSLLETVFQLVTSVLTLVIIGALGYVGYQVLIASKNNSDQS